VASSDRQRPPGAAVPERGSALGQSVDVATTGAGGGLGSRPGDDGVASRGGRHGVTALRLALEEWIDDELPPDSELEARMARLIRTHRLPDVQFHAIVEGYEVDFLVVGTKVILECDGWGSHGLDRNQFEFDRIRNNDLLAAGYLTAHFTWPRLKNHPARVAQQIQQVLARWAA
jgi:very-short-patch-repair endonuclease